MEVSLDECWLYAKSINHSGYPQFYHKLNGKGISEAVHRLSYEAEYGKIPDGLEMDHICRVRRCINPEHLRAVTHRQNMEYMRQGDPNYSRNYCGKGLHEMTEGNYYTYLNKKTKRMARKCRPCTLETTRIKDAKLRELKLTKKGE